MNKLKSKEIIKNNNKALIKNDPKQQQQQATVPLRVQPSAPPLPPDHSSIVVVNSPQIKNTKALLASKQFHLTNEDIIQRQPLTPKLNPKL
jgi:hypothetical protein